MYDTDYSTVDYELETLDGREHISSHVAAETFGDATAMTYVVGSDVHGGMGKDLLPFSERDDATAFVDEHGGRTIGYGDVDESFIADYRR